MHEMPLDDSVVSLIRRLAKSQWQDAYAILLHEPRLEHNSSSDHSAKIPIVDVAISFRMRGRISDAQKLESLLLCFDDYEPTLALLAALTRSRPTVSAQRKTYGFPVESWIVEKKNAVPINVFSFDVPKPDDRAVIVLEENDIIGSTATRLLESDLARMPALAKQFDVPPPVEVPKLKPMKRPSSHTRKPPILRSPENRFPSELTSILFLLLNSIGMHGATFENINATPAPLKQIQNEEEMTRRRRSHFERLPCYKRGGTYIIDIDTLQRPSLSSLRDDDARQSARAKFCGEVYELLASFSAAYMNSPGRILSAVAGYAARLLDEYQTKIMNALDNPWDCSTVCWKVLFIAEECVEDAFTIVKLLGRVERTSGSASAVLDVLNNALTEHLYVDPVRQLYYAAFSPYLEMIMDWIFCASSSRDSGREFFGTVLGNKITDSEALLCAETLESAEDGIEYGMYPCVLGHATALFVLRSGRSRALLELISSDHYMLTVRPVAFNLPVNLENLKLLSSSIQDYVEDVDNGGKNSCFKHVDKAPDALRQGNPGFELEQLCGQGTGTAEKCFRTPEKVPVVELETYGTFSVPVIKPSIGNDGNEERLLSLASPATEIYNRVFRNLRAADVQVQREVLSFLVDNIRVYDHLKLLADYALLGAGEFADILVEQINLAEVVSLEHERFIIRRVNAARTFYGTSGGGGSSIRKQRHLAGCFQTALHHVGSEKRELIDKFSIGVGEWETTNTIWETPLTVEYEAEFPLNVVITTEALSLYSKFFNFFLSVHRARKCLRSLYLHSRRQRFALNNDPVLNVKLWQFSGHADHFVTIVGGYQFNQLHGSTRRQFEQDCVSVLSIWELCEKHMNYLSGSIRRVLLGEKQKFVMAVIRSALETVFRVENEVTKYANRPDATAIPKLVKTLDSGREGLRKNATFLIEVLEKLVSTGAEPHLQDFLVRLNFNSFYGMRDSPG